MQLMNKTKSTLIADKVTVAKSFSSRLIGLLGHKSLSATEALWIYKCNSIHTFFMNFVIDAVFVDKELKVKACYSYLKPWRMTKIVFGASSVFEIQAGKIIENNIEVGDQLYVVN